MLNSTHCSSSQEFDEVSKILRTVALVADTSTAARMSQATYLPIQVLMASIAGLTGSNDFKNESTGSPTGRPLTGPLSAASPRPPGQRPARSVPANPMGPAPVN